MRNLVEKAKEFAIKAHGNQKCAFTLGAFYALVTITLAG